MPFIASPVHDPFANAAVESLLFDRVTAPLLYVWTNDPCVVLGRHQNPWVECNMASLRDAGVPLVRRISGGGTVYHDRGNVNFSFMAGEQHYDLDFQFAVVLRALRGLGVDAARNDRNDLVLGGRKFSGNAFRHSRGNSLHHGTLLVESDLTKLTAYLAAPSAEIQTKAIASVRSVVVNLSEVAEVDTAAVVEALAESFAERTGDHARVLPTDPPSWFPTEEEIAGEQSRLAGWEWVFGHTPTFSRVYRDEAGGIALSIRVKKGHIEHAVVEGVPDSVAELEGRPLTRQTIDVLADNTRLRTLRDTLMEDLW